MLPAGGPGKNEKLQILYSGKQGFTVPAEPSPAESGCEQPTDRLSWRTKPPFCFFCLQGCSLLGPSRA